MASKVSKVLTRKSVDSFHWEADCLLCEKSCIADKKNSERRLAFNVTFLHYRETILKYCSNGRNYKLSEDVNQRVFNCNELVYEEARYNDNCEKLFTHPENTEANSSRLARRPRKEFEQENFFKLHKWLEGKEIYFLRLRCMIK